VRWRERRREPAAAGPGRVQEELFRRMRPLVPPQRLAPRSGERLLRLRRLRLTLPMVVPLVPVPVLVAVPVLVPVPVLGLVAVEEAVGVGGLRVSAEVLEVALAPQLAALLLVRSCSAS